VGGRGKNEPTTEKGTTEVFSTNSSLEGKKGGKDKRHLKKLETERGTLLSGRKVDLYLWG